MGFPEELIKNRKRKEMTQEELAEKFNISRQAVGKWETGETIHDFFVYNTMGIYEEKHRK